MDQLAEKLKALLIASDPEKFRIVSVTNPTGETVTYMSYKDLMDAYLQARTIAINENAGAFRPIRIGRGSRL